MLIVPLASIYARTMDGPHRAPTHTAYAHKQAAATERTAQHAGPVAADRHPPCAEPQDGARQAIAFDQVWPKVTRLNLYDPLTLLASVPGAAGMLFTPRQIQTDGLSVVEQIGENDVRHSEKAKLLMSALAKAALAKTK